MSLQIEIEEYFATEEGKQLAKLADTLGVDLPELIDEAVDTVTNEASDDNDKADSDGYDDLFYQGGDVEAESIEYVTLTEGFALYLENTLEKILNDEIKLESVFEMTRLWELITAVEAATVA